MKNDIIIIENKKNSVKIQYNILERNVGSGSTCVCHIAMCSSNGRICLIKEFLNYWDAPNDAELLSERIASIKEIYRQKGLNYCLDEYFIGSSVDKTPITYYQVFQYIEGETLTAPISFDYREERFRRIVEQYFDFLRGLSVFHDNQILHMDIKPSNIFSFSVNDPNKRSLQLLDFGSLSSISEAKNNFEEGDYRIRSSSRPWYSEEDENKLLDDIDCEDDDIINVMDCTAAARIFAFMLCGDGDETSRKLDQYLEQLPQEGVRLALEAFFAKAFANDLKDRYLDVADMISHIEYICDSYRENPITIAGYKIKAISEDETVKELRRVYRWNRSLKDNAQIMIDDLSEEICTSILPGIMLNSGQSFVFNNASETPLSQCIKSRTTENLFLTGDGGFGKTTSLRKEFLKNIADFQNQDHLFIYAPLKDWNDGLTVEAFIIRNSCMNNLELVDRYPERVVIMMDAYDEIPIRISEENRKEQLKEIQLLTKKGVRFIITSRFVPDALRKSNMIDKDKGDLKPLFTFGEFQKLTEKQIREYLQSSFCFDTVVSINPLINLLKNAMMLTIFLRLKKREGVFVTNEVDLIRQYLFDMYENKHQLPLSKYELENFFENELNEIAQIVSDRNNNQAKLLNLKVHFGCFDPIFRITKNLYNWPKNEENEKYDIRFQHNIFREFFLAKSIANSIINTYNSNNDFSFVETALSFREPSHSNVYLFVGFFLHSVSQIDYLLNKISQHLKESSPDTLAAHNFFHIVSLLGCDMRVDTNGLITFIPSHWFEDSSRLINIVIPNSVKSIGQRAFRNCSSLLEVDLGDNIQNIEVATFENCVSLEKIFFGNGILEIPDNMFSNFKKLKHVKIGSGIKRIGKGAFKNCFVLEDLDISESAMIKTIDNYSFSGCTGLSELKMPKSVTIIGCNAFSDCKNIRDIYFNEGTKTIDAHAFSKCDALENINLPKSLRVIGSHAFDGCKKITEIYIPDAVREIGRYSFFNCLNLKQVSIGGNVKKMNAVFIGCQNLHEIQYRNKKNKWDMIQHINLICKDCVIHCLDGDAFIKY